MLKQGQEIRKGQVVKRMSRGQVKDNDILKTRSGAVYQSG